MVKCSKWLLQKESRQNEDGWEHKKSFPDSSRHVSYQRCFYSPICIRSNTISTSDPQRWSDRTDFVSGRQTFRRPRNRLRLIGQDTFTPFRGRSDAQCSKKAPYAILLILSQWCQILCVLCWPFCQRGSASTMLNICMKINLS